MTSSPEDRSSPLPSVPPSADRIGHYKIIREIGRGGQGIVYFAEDTRLHRRVALKVLKGMESLSAESLARFRREAEAASRLDHPGICAVYEAAMDGKLPYIAMRFVEGESLAAKIASARWAGEPWTNESFVDQSRGHDSTPPGRPSTDPSPTPSGPSTRAEIMRVVELIEKVARSLHAAHEAGVVHRDMKPGNVMVTPDGEAVVMDFGLAHLEDEHFPTLTQTGEFFGTPAYMSPEQLLAQRIRLDRRTDVWSLGVMLYECMTLSRPFDAPTREGVYQAIQTRDPPNLLRLNPSIMADLQVVVATALEKDRDRRYQSALDLAEELRRVRMHEPILAKPVGALVRLQRWAQRNAALAIAVGGLFVVLIAGLAVALVFLSQRDRALADVTNERDAKKAALTEVTTERNEKQAALTDRSAALADYDRLGDLSRLQSLSAAADKLWPCEPARAPAMKTWLEQATQLANHLGEHREALERLRASSHLLPYTDQDRALDRASHATEEAALRALMGNRAAELRDPQIKRVDALLKAARFEDATSLLAELREAFPVDVAILSRIGDALRLQGRYEEAVRQYRDCLLLEPGSPGSHIGLALTFGASGDRESEVIQLQRMVQVCPFFAEWARQRLASLERLAARPASGPTAPARQPAQDPAVMQSADREYQQLLDATSAKYRAPVQRLQAARDERTTWRFDSSAEQFKHDTTETLVRELTAFCAPDPKNGLIANVRARLAFAESVESESIAKYRAQWATALSSIPDESDCPTYKGLTIKAQLGLVPIGKDPVSGLWEFAHVQSTAPGTDPIPKRGTDGRLIMTESTGLVFVLIPGGTFRMGSTWAGGAHIPEGPNLDAEARADESPVMEVRLEPFFSSKYEMTQGQWLRLVGRNPSRHVPGDKQGGRVVDLRYPVEQISWSTCDLWLGRFGLMLPTEAQWEYAARGGTTTPRWSGLDRERLSKAANVADASLRDNVTPGRALESWDDGYPESSPIGVFEPNPFGLHDVLGNVWEWCRDAYGGYQLPPRERDGLRTPPDSRERLVRGASWHDPAALARCAMRIAVTPDYHNDTIGVRPVREVSKD